MGNCAQCGFLLGKAYREFYKGMVFCSQDCRILYQYEKEQPPRELENA